MHSAGDLVICLGDFNVHVGRHFDEFDEVHSFRNINPPSDTHTANKILRNTILNADKHNIPKGKIHHNCKLLPEDIRTKINTRNNIRKHNPLDPNLAQLNNEITSDIQHHKTALWKSHLDGNWDHRKKHTPYGKL